MSELENALAQHAPPIKIEDPSRHEMPPLVIDGIPTPVEKMTQAQLRAFIPLMLQYSTGMYNYQFHEKKIFFFHEINNNFFREICQKMRYKARVRNKN